MNERVSAVIAKEWEEARKNSTLVLTAVIPAILFAVMPAFMIFTLRGQMGPLGQIPEEFRRAIFGEFLMFFILLPVIIPSTMGSFSIIGEKQNRSLEPLLATPITTSELLLGKSLAAVVPGIVLTWGTYVLSIILVAVSSGPKFISMILRPEAVAIVGLFSPAMAILGMLLIILISARSNDPREAQQWSILVILPAIGLSMSVIFGKVVLTVPLVAAIAALVGVIDFFVLKVVVAGFQREKILTSWK